jgi:competence protein ComEC
MSKAWYVTGLILGLIVLAILQAPGDKAKMVVCDVGQGDAIIISKGHNQVLVDGGPSSDKILSCLENEVPFYDRKIELIVLTNSDFDHMNGISAVVERYRVIQFVTADGVHESASLNKLVDKLAENKVRAGAVERGDKLVIADKQGRNKLEFEIIWPPDTNEEYVAVFSDQINEEKRKQVLGASAKRGNLNERSVGMKLLEGNKKILLMGDLGDQSEKALIEMGILDDIDILKVGHHGSKYATTREFLQIIKPELAVISVGAKNSYGHPTEQTLTRLQEIGSQVRRTDLDGQVEIEL